MDYEFIYDVDQQRIICKCSMGHEALAQWLMKEINLDALQLQRFDTWFNQLDKQYAKEKWEGHAYSIFIDQGEVIIQENGMDVDDSEQIAELGDSLHIYDDESIACCGIEDFSEFMEQYRLFLAERVDNRGT